MSRDRPPQNRNDRRSPISARGLDELPPGLVEEIIALVSEMSRQAVALSADISAELGVHPTDVNALHVLAAAPVALTTGQLGAALGLSSAAATGLVDRLVDEGLATRRPDPDDRRKSIVEATDRALDLSFRHLAPLFDRVGRAIGEADEDELSSIVAFLRRLTGSEPDRER